MFNNYCWGDDVMNAARLLYAATITLTYPLECFVCRDVLRSLLADACSLDTSGQVRHMSFD